MTQQEEIEIERVKRALDIAKRSLERIAAPCTIGTAGDASLSAQGVSFALKLWAQGVLKKMEDVK